MVEASRVVRPVRPLGLPLVAWLALFVVLVTVLGGVYMVVASRATPPSLPAAPPGAHQLWASQTTDMIQGNQILTVALYRVSAPPAAAIAYYRRVIPGQGGTVGRFGAVITSGAASALPSTLQHLPRDFASGKGARLHVRYTYTAYRRGRDDVAVAVDLRHPHGPTLVFVEMLSP